MGDETIRRSSPLHEADEAAYRSRRHSSGSVHDAAANSTAGVIGDGCTDPEGTTGAKLDDGDAATTSCRTETLVDLLRLARQAIERLFLLECARSGLTPRQHSVLRAIADAPGVNQTSLCELTGVDRSTLSDVIRRLESKGWCIRTRAPDDRRAYSLNLTAEGGQTLARSGQAASAVEQCLTETIGTGQRALLADALRAISEARLDKLSPRARRKRVLQRRRLMRTSRSKPFRQCQ